MVVFGIGAGLRPAELVALRGSDVIRRGQRVAVHVSGPAAQVMPVTAPYAGRAAALAAGAGTSYLFRPGPADRGYKNFVTNFARALTADPAAPRLTVSRCRSSFICDHLAAGTPFGDKLPGPEDAVASAYDFGQQLLAGQRKFAENLLKAKPEGAVASTYDFAEQLLASQRKFAEDLVRAAAPLMPGRAESARATETYKPGQVVPRDGTVECARHHDVQNHVKAGTRFAPCSHHHEHSEGCTWRYV